MWGALAPHAPPWAEVAGHFIKRFRTVLPFQSSFLVLG